MPVFQEMNVPVPVEEVLKRLGRKSRMQVSPQLARLANDEAERCRPLMTPKGVYERFGLSLDGDSGVRFTGRFSVRSADLRRWVRGCDEVVVMVVTVGEGIGARVEELVRAGEVTRGMIADAVGSETVEEVANVLTRIVTNAARRSTTKRYSPGYGDWAVTDQGALLELVGAERIGVRVNASAQMIPEKSISAVIGLKDRAGTLRRSGDLS
jgi:hypothetical protein